jgi:hypothetical protein
MRAGRWIDASLGWTLSLGVHVALLFGAALMVIDQFIGTECYEDIGFSCGLRDHGLYLDYTEAPPNLLERRGLFDDSDSGGEVRRELVDLLSAIPDRPREPAESGSGTPDGSCAYCVDLSAGLANPAAVPPQRTGSSVQSGWVTGSVLRYRTRLGTESLAESGATHSFLKSGRRSPEGNGDPVRSWCQCRLQSAVPASLRWLARHQNPDGRWSADGFGRCCKRTACSGAGLSDFDEGVTALTLLAFLGSGWSPISKDVCIDPAVPEQELHFGESVKWGLRWLISRQDIEGCIGGRGSKFMYNHAIATLALSEAYECTSFETFRAPAQKAIDFLVAAQNPGAGWRYGICDGESDTSVTGWAALALASAELSGFSVPQGAVTGALAWIEKATERGGIHRVGYTRADSGKVFIPGRNESFADHPTMSAVGIASRLLLRKDRRDPSLNSALLLGADLPAWEVNKVDLCYWYFGSLALYQLDGPQGPCWTKWNEPLKAAIVPKCRTARDGCENGSWDPADDRWGSEGGRVYATAMNSLTLEVYYRYSMALMTNATQR